jgi:hypothetical protein
MSRLKALTRDYPFQDSHLIQLADGTLILITRDAIYFSNRGHTEVKTAALQRLRDDFVATKPDEYFQGMVSVRTEEKYTAKGALTTKMRTILVAAENVFGTHSGVYSTFGVSAISKLDDEDLVRKSRLVIDTARDNIIKMADEGINEAFLDAADVALDTFDKALDAQLLAQRDRDSATNDRITKGNLLYHEIVKICNTGKDIWYETDESKYNDYVIYNTPSGKPEETGLGSVRGKVTDESGKLLEGVVCTFVGTEIVVESDEFGEYEADSVPIGKHRLEFELADFEKYIDEIVEVFENQETINDIEMEKIETPAPVET